MATSLQPLQRLSRPAMDFQKVQEIWLPTRISAVAISPLGTQVATGDMDGVIIVWAVETGKVEQTFSQEGGQGGVTALAWDREPGRGGLLYAGTEFGACYCFQVKEAEGSQIGSPKDGPVSAIEVGKLKGQLVAWAAGKSVQIGSMSEFGMWETAQCEDPPTLARAFEEEEVLPVGIRFIGRDERLLVAYLHHGIVCWNRRALGKPAWRILPIHSGRRIGSFAVSPDEKFVAIVNLTSGVDLYSTRTRKMIRHVSIPLDSFNNVPFSARFVWEGAALVAGSHYGDVWVRNASTGEPIESLIHPGQIVQLVEQEVHRTHEIVVTVGNDNRELYVWVYEWGNIWRRRTFIARRRLEVFLRENSALMLQVLVALVAICLIPQSRKLLFIGYEACLRFQRYILEMILGFWAAIFEQLAEAALSKLGEARGNVRRWLGIEDMEERLQEFVCSPDIEIPLVWWRKCKNVLHWVRKDR
ncbi:WD40 repeat-like protein [Coprinellus micaceus]|uniref:WD40 repeat-like protein n=1 Tax=Coprinellus micaceus TaxID=71717 RepID=A0A4Y7SZ52_COPMI|nr:WD40 repeat-like protein [Coprinellus micaceus]